MKTQEVANKLVQLCREGKNAQAIEELYADDVVSIEPKGAHQQEVRGKDSVLQKDKFFQDAIKETHASSVTDPIVADRFFSVGMRSDVTTRDGHRMNMEEVCMYEVNDDGKVIREEFFFTHPEA